MVQDKLGSGKHQFPPFSMPAHKCLFPYYIFEKMWIAQLDLESTENLILKQLIRLSSHEN